MTDIALSKVTKFYGENQILNGLSFEIHAGEKVGLLGKNGAGKTTVFKIIAGELDYDGGTVSVAKGRNIGVLSQIPEYPPEFTVDDVLKDAFRPLFDMKAEMEALALSMQRQHTRDDLRRYGELSARFESLGGYETEIFTAKVANGLEIGPDMRSRRFSSLSGGEQTRVNLARLILTRTDILLLDEPTNHLDMRAVEWLENYLLAFRGTVLAISHDRYFLDSLAGRVIEIKDGAAEFYAGNYSFYVIGREMRYAERLDLWEEQERRIKKLEDAARRMHTWAQGHDNPSLHKAAFAMERRIERLRTHDRPTRERQITHKFSRNEFGADEIISAKNLSKSYGDRVIFQDLNLNISNGERVALLGDNGTGKTTLLRVLLGLDAADSGFLKRGPSVKAAFLPQVVSFQNEERSLCDTLIYELGCSPASARNMLGGFRFTGDDVFKRVSDLSGGEKSRLKLCMLMAGEVNFLVLDEPTNHLDIASREWIEDAVADFQGTLLFVSHDRYFINRFAERVLYFDGRGVTDFKGNFETFRKLPPPASPSPEARSGVPKPVRAKKPDAKSIAKKLAAVEREITANEERLNSIDAALSATNDYERLQALLRDQSDEFQRRDRLYADWVGLDELQNTL